MSKTFNKMARWTVDQRWAVMLLLSVITGISLVGYLDPGLPYRLYYSLFPRETVESEGSSSQSTRNRAVANVSPFTLSRSDVVLVVDGEDFFTADCAKALRQVVDDLESLDQVDRIVWMDRVPPLNIFGLPEPLFPRSEASATRFEAARQKAMQHPLVGGQLLSNDGKTLLMLLSLNFLHVLDDKDATELIRTTAENTARQFPEAKLTFQVTGSVPATIAAIESHEANQLKYQLIGYGVILLMTVILFRGIRAVMIVAVAPILGVFWTLGIVRFFEYYNNPLIDVILPVLISLV